MKCLSETLRKDLINHRQQQLYLLSRPMCMTLGYNGILTLILLTWRIWWTPNNASRWQMGFNSAFKWLMVFVKADPKTEWEPNITLVKGWRKLQDKDVLDLQAFLIISAEVEWELICRKCNAYEGWQIHAKVWSASRKSKKKPYRSRSTVKVKLYPFIHFDASWWWMVSAMPWLPYPLRKGWKWKAGWDSWLVWKVVHNLFPIWFRIPDRPDSSQSLYRLRFSDPWKSISGKPRRRLNDVLSYLSVVYLLCMLYFKISCVYCC